MKNRSVDLTSGSIVSQLFKLSIPIIGASFMQMAYNLTDMFWLGNLGEDAVAAVGIAGFFAKFTQRTLNNKRFPNAALNIITASVLGTVVSFVWVLIGSLSSDDATLTFTDALKREGLSFLLIAGAAILIFLLLAKVLPQVFIPRDTPFLSRKEKSKLLND